MGSMFEPAINRCNLSFMVASIDGSVRLLSVTAFLPWQVLSISAGVVIQKFEAAKRPMIAVLEWYWSRLK
jgi:hypothetical protein